MIDWATQRYQRYRWRVDRRLACLTVAIGSLALVAFARNDLLLFRGTQMLRFLFAARSIIVTINLVALAVMLRTRRPRCFDLAFAVSTIVVAMSTLIVGATRLRLGVVSGQLLTNVFHLTFLYFALRGALWFRLVAALEVTASSLLIVFSSAAAVNAVTRGALVISCVVFNLLGLYSARSQEAERRRRFDAERALRLAQRRLDAKLIELAAERERALALARTRSTFLATMSHEFRTPMNAVIGLSELLVEAPLSEEHRRYARTIRESAGGLLALLNDILDFTRIDAGKLSLSLAGARVRYLVAAVAEMLRPAAAARSLELSVRIADEVPDGPLLTDESRLRQVLVNLLSNAIKFTERGQIRLEVTAQPQEEGHHPVTFRVLDTGCGIAKDALPRLFQPFEQAHEGIERRFGGSGLGLAISRSIVATMGGTLGVDSQPDRGSCFWFTLRLSSAAEPQSAHSEQPAQAAAPLRILLVDDHPINREVAALALRRLGYGADLADDGPSAIRAATAQRYDLILMDLQMPGMGGLDTARRLLAQASSGPAPHIVAMTASVMEADRAECSAAGLRGFLGKPIDLRELAQVLRSAAAGRPAGDEALLSATAVAELRSLEAEGEPGFLEALQRKFIADTSQRLALMQRAAAQGEVATLRRHAHLMAATSGTLGATVLREHMLRIETLAATGELGGLLGTLQDAIAEFARVQRALGPVPPVRAAPSASEASP